jgi:hypothetical protein
MHSLLRALLALAALSLSSAPSFAQCSPRERALWRDALTAASQLRLGDYTAYVNQISIPCQNLIVAEMNGEGGPYPANQMQCRMLWDQFDRCQKDFNYRVAAGGRPMYTCRRPTCTR